MKTLLSTLLLASFALGIAACGGGVCSSTPTCPNDVKATDAEVTMCKALLADANCGAKFETLGKCANGVACGSDGKSDGTAIAAACSAESAAYSMCIAPG